MGLLSRIHPTGVAETLQPGIVSFGFHERGEYQFLASVAGASLYIDEAPAEPTLVGGLPGWRWQPGFYAGQVVAELLGETGERLAEYRFDVAPDDGKLGADVFNGMLDEIFAFNPALLLGSESAQANVGVSGDFTSPLVAYARLRRHGDNLLASLQAVACLPLTRLRRERALLPYHRLRRLDTVAARGLLRRAETASMILGKGDSITSGSLPLINVAHSFDDLDNPANRTLMASLVEVRRRCVQVADELRAMAQEEKESGARTPLEPRIAKKLEFLDGLSGKLAKLSRRDPFASVSRVEVTAAGLNAVSAHPCYARAYRFAWLALRPGVAGDDREECMWLSPTWEIYERWCFTRLASGLRERYPRMQWSMRYPAKRSDCIVLEGTESSMRIEAWLQRRFRAGDRAAGGLRSISAELHPDLLVTMECAGKRRMLVLDAKYRTSRKNVLDAMRSAHIYQDALRWNDAKPDASILLVPKGGGAPWLEESEFHREHRVGVYELTPESSDGICELLEQWLLPPGPAR